MIYHFVVGDMAAIPLREAILTESSMQGEVVVIKDLLNLGPLVKEEGQSFSELRSAFWQEVVPNEKNPILVNDMEKLLEVSAAMFKDETIQAWFWMAPSAADVCAYYWLLPYLSKHLGRFYLINIAGLPFLNEQGKIYYPKNFSEILPKEIIKARKLARQVTPSEMEVDTDEWKKIVEENTGLRIHEGGKKLSSKNENHFDEQLISFCSLQFQKVSKIVKQAITKYNMPTGDLWLGWRLRKLSNEERIVAQGDTTKALNEWDVKLHGELNLDTSTTEASE